ncbi:hypothetical protein KP509_02G101500 [Ceratopteris richardii]|nr:hypothetical protein KP509_02G101500 [Ceratopteris richardii]KAH7444997.1 hypothetical protein KP509_02G101500 [Ceratopteris richardii]KAH7444998.1 hypothetical protein KP509_02G101500 [Ceratopteris richardii]
MPFIPNLGHAEATGNGHRLSDGTSAKVSLETTSRMDTSRSEPSSGSEPVPNAREGVVSQQAANNYACLSDSSNSTSRKSFSSTSTRSLTPVSNRRPSTASSNGHSSTPATNGRPVTPSSGRRSVASNAQSSTRSSTPTRTGGAIRVSASSGRPSTPTGRPAVLSSTRAASSAGPPVITSLTRSTSSSGKAPSIHAAGAFSTSASNQPISSSSRASTPVKRPSTPVKRPSTPVRTGNATSTITRSSSLPATKSAASSRPSSPAGRLGQPAGHATVLPGFSQEPPPNLRTSVTDRPVSNSRGSLASRAAGTRPTQPDGASDGTRNLRLSGSPVVTRGRISTDLSNNDKPGIKNSKQLNAAQAAPANGIHSKMVDRSVPTRKPVILPEKQSDAVTPQVKKPIKSSPVRDVKSTAPVRESTGFGRNLSKKSLDMALRHMDIRQNASGFKSFMSNVPASSLFSVRSNNGKVFSSSSAADSPVATSSNASSEEHSMTIAVDQDGSDLGDEMLSEKGSKTSLTSQVVSYNERKVNSWLNCPNGINRNHDNIDILQAFEQGIERLSSSESPLVSPCHGSSIECDNFMLDSIQ